MSRWIVLARHGRPEWSDSTLISGHALGEWIEGRNAAPIDPSHRPPPELRRIAMEAKGFAVSTLRRSIESLHLLVPDAIPYVDAVFREVEPPGDVPSSLRLPAQAWSKIARVAWWAGWSADAESYAASKRRADRAAEILISIAPEQGTLLLVGHGLFNGMIGTRLRRLGWQGPRFRPRRQWSFGVYREGGKD